MASTAKHKYRYILAGYVRPSDPISAFRLIGASNLGHTDSAIRIVVDDVKLTKYSCDCYSTTNDTRTLAELGYDCMVRINWKWVIQNSLRPINNNDLFNISEKMYLNGYVSALCKESGQHTYLDEEHAKEYYKKLFGIK